MGFASQPVNSAHWTLTTNCETTDYGIRGRKTEDGGRRTEDGGRKLEGRREKLTC
jgi:hypothetical protein